MKNIQHWTYINTKLKKIAVVYKIRITPGVTSVSEVAALFSPARIIFKSRQSHQTVFSA